MICPNCLTNNRNTAIECKNCRCSLVDVLKDDNDIVSEENISRNITSDPLRYQVEDISADDIEYDDDILSQDTIVISPIKDNTINTRPRRSANPERYYTSTTTHRRPVKRRRATMVVTILIWLLIFVGIGLGIGFGIKYAVELFGGGSPGSTQTTKLPASAPDMQIRLDESGNQYLNCVFYGNDGDSVLIQQTNKRYTFENGQATVDLLLSDFISSTSNITTDTLPVTVQAVYRYADGTEVTLSIAEQTFTIPSTTVQMINPQSKAIEIYKDSYTLVFAIPVGSNLYINEVMSNDKVDSTGKVKYTVSVKEGESVNINVSARAPYHKNGEIMFTVYRQEQNAKLTLSNSNPKNVTEKTVIVSGVTEPKSTITCNADYTISDVLVNDSSGVFTLKLQLPVYGTHDVVFSTTTTDGRTGKLAYTVTYAPNEDSYTRKAWAYEKGVAENPGQFMNKSFLLSNVQIEEFILAEDTMFLINMGTTEEPQFIYVQYNGNMPLATSKKYRIFGDVIGVHEGKTLFAARFIYNA